MATGSRRRRRRGRVRRGGRGGESPRTSGRPRPRGRRRLEDAAGRPTACRVWMRPRGSPKRTKLHETTRSVVADDDVERWMGLPPPGDGGATAESLAADEALPATGRRPQGAARRRKGRVSGRKTKSPWQWDRRCDSARGGGATSAAVGPRLGSSTRPAPRQSSLPPSRPRPRSSRPAARKPPRDDCSPRVSWVPILWLPGYVGVPCSRAVHSAFKHRPLT